MTGFTMSWGAVFPILVIAAIHCAVTASTSTLDSSTYATNTTIENSSTNVTETSASSTTTEQVTTSATSWTQATEATSTIPPTTITTATSAPTTATTTSVTSTNVSSATTSESSNSPGIMTATSTSPTQPVFNTTLSPQTDVTIIIGASVGGAAFVLLLVVVISLIVCRRRRVLCWKRHVPTSDSKDSLTDIPTSRNQGYDMWSLDSGIGKEPCPSLSTVEAGTANEGFSADPDSSCQDEDQRRQHQIHGAESDIKDTGPEVYAVVNKVKHPARHEYTNVSVKERTTPGEPDKAHTSPTLVSELEKMLARSPKSTKRSPLLPLELKSPVVTVHATADSGNRTTDEKPRPAVAKKPQVFPKPARTGAKKTAMIPPDNKLLYQFIQEDHAQSPKQKPETAPKPQQTALLPHFLKPQQPTEQSTNDADRTTVSRDREGNMDALKDDRGPHNQNDKQDSGQEVPGPVSATSLPQPEDDRSGVSKQLQKKSDDRLAVLKAKLENQTLISDQHHGDKNKAEIRLNGAGSKGPSPQEPINETDAASRPDSSTYYSAIDSPSTEGAAPFQDDGSDNYYTVPGPPLKAAATRADNAACYCVTDIVGESMKQQEGNVDYNVLKFDRENATVDVSAGDDDVNDKESGHLYNRLNEGDGDDVYSHAEPDGKKRQVIDDNYCHIKF